MPRQSGVAVDNNFSRGLITEASGLNFPENACTETWNCEFDVDGSVRRRLGFEYETDHQEKNIDRNNKVVNTYLWRNVAGNGDYTVLVVQVGRTLHFYLINSDIPYSQGEVVSTVTLNHVTGTTQAQAESKEMQFCDGNGFLYVTHPNMDPARISFDTATQTASAAQMSMYIRDFEGITTDPYAIDFRPTSTLAALDDRHRYNLYNQGWHTDGLTAWDTAQTTMPSNADVMWNFKDSSENLDFSAASLARIVAGNTKSPNGHFILDIAYQDRNTLIGVTGLPNTHQPGVERPSTCAFFAGRLWMAGINKNKFNTKIYFSQVIERDEQATWFFQQNDPTSEELFDLLSTDGGVIDIQEAGTIHKLITVPGGMAVFAEKGVWYITGSSGIGFVANDYTVQKIAEIPAISATSFVNVAGYPSWWNGEGIYLMTAQGNLPQIQSLTAGKIKDFYDAIPLGSKKKARGIWHYTDNHIRWIYRNISTDQITEMYEFDRVLNFNTQTGAFYPWTISDAPVKVNAIIVSDLVAGTIGTDNVIDGSGNNVIDGSSNDVVVFSSTGTETSPFDKYLVSYAFSGFNRFSFADKINANYLDWFSHDQVERDYNSYFITGYKVRGDGIRKFQNNWIRIFSRLNDTDAAYYFQGLWDYATSGNTGRWSVKQIVDHPNTQHSVVTKRLKVRGHGIALQFKVSSVTQEPFDILGWSTFQSLNTTP